MYGVPNFTAKNGKLAAVFGANFSNGMEGVIVKIEDEDAVVDGGAAPSTRPLQSLIDLGTPPFLTKTFEMVEDSVISWSGAKNSFIVWDPHQLSATLLPRFFKHNNFSSFVGQHNTYLTVIAALQR